MSGGYLLGVVFVAVLHWSGGDLAVPAGSTLAECRDTAQSLAQAIGDATQDTVDWRCGPRWRA